MSAGSPPLYVVDSAAAAATALRRLAAAGWRTREGFTDAGWDLTVPRLVLFGPVPDPDTARLAVVAAARGVGVVAIADPTSETGRALVADLRRIGAVRHDPDSRTDPADPPAPAGDGVLPLSPQQRALLERLANGETIAAAAAAEFLSLRTANRRIAQARQALGVRTTREAVLEYLRHRAGR